MHRQTLGSSRRWSALAAALALLTVLAFVPAAHAQTSGDVTVTATVATTQAPLVLTLCDPTADFGANLDATGTASASTDTVLALPGNAANNEGAFYRWTPGCASGAAFITVDATASWTGSVCATENTGTNSIRLADGELRYSPSALTTYGTALSSTPFQVCGAGAATWATGSGGLLTRNFHYYLQIDRNETAGAFASTTTWSISS